MTDDVEAARSLAMRDRVEGDFVKAWLTWQALQGTENKELRAEAKRLLDISREQMGVLHG